MSFKPSKITPGFNLTWEGSRMMLPEHVAMLQKHKQLQRQNHKPILDPQALQELQYEIHGLYEQDKVALITVFQKYGDPKRMIGKITKIDPLNRKIKLRGEEEAWISFDDVIDVEEYLAD